MFRTLRTKLFLAFALVIGLALFLAGVTTIILLRDKEEGAARERVGRMALPMAFNLAAMDLSGRGQQEILGVIHGNAERYNVRILLLDPDLQVFADTGGRLEGKYILAFQGRRAKAEQAGSARFRYARYRQAGETLLLFAAPTDGLSPVEADVLNRAYYQTVLAVPESEISAAWMDLAPRLALAAAISLAASAVVAVFLSRSITRPLGRISAASREMAQGRYDQQIEVRGSDEVARVAVSFNAMAREVARSQRAMRDFLANVSHDLKTPLTSIQGFSQAIAEGAAGSPEDIEEAGRIIHQEAQRMRGLVDDLLYLSQIESGQMEMRLEPLDIADLLRACGERFEWRLKESGATLTFDVPPLPSFEGDGRRLDQAFGNLIDNAVAYTPAGGVITVTARHQGGELRVEVHNTGSYIPPEDLGRVFERFFRVDRARRTGHSGLGLAIAAEVVEAHGGTIRAASSPEDGTRFTVTLPYRVPPPKPRRAARAAHPSDQPRPTEAAPSS